MGRGDASLRRGVRWTLAAVGFAMLAAAPAAQAQFAITDWRAQVYDSNAVTEAREIDGNVFNPAGGHPFIGVTDFTLSGTEDDNVKNLGWCRIRTSRRAARWRSSRRAPARPTRRSARSG
jgi:hypothetical protein